MYWQKRFDRKNPNLELEQKILEIKKIIRISDIEGFMVN
jgi:hypothetical protein